MNTNITLMEKLVFSEKIVNQAWHVRMADALGSISSAPDLSAVETLIRRRYVDDPVAADGYSRIACHLLARNGNLQIASQLFEKDAVAGRQTWYQKLRHAECVASAGDLDAAFAMVEKVYKDHPEARNGYAAIAWQLQCQVDLLPSPWACAGRDLAAQRLTPGYMLNAAELAMRENRLDEAGRLVAAAYQSDPELTDGYARCAWSYFLPKREYPRLVEWLERDHASGRLTPAWQLNFAQACAGADLFERACALVAAAYSAKPELFDGYARCAWQYFWPRQEYLRLVEWMERDFEAGKLSGTWMMKLAQAYAAAGELEKACNMVEVAYAGNSDLRDGFARIGRMAATSGNNSRALAIINRDKDAGRLTDDGQRLAEEVRDMQINWLSGCVQSLLDENTFLMNALFPMPLVSDCHGADAWLAGVKDLHKGERCFILATGPSLNKVDLSKLKGETLFGVNGTYKLMEVQLTYFTYVSNWYLKHHLDGLRHVRCTRRFIPSCLPELASEVATSWLNVHMPRYFSSAGAPLPVPAHFSFAPDRYVFAGGTVLYLCFQLAHYLGFKEVVLLGVDHSYGKDDEKAKKRGGTMVNLVGKDQSHFDKDYVPADISYHVDLDAMERGYMMAKQVFEADHRRILNASPGTHLEVFPKVDFDSLF